MMNLIISLIFIASVSATPMPDFCPDTPVIKNVVKKRELCPGSRSVEDILKELACVQNTIVELTTALIRVESTQEVVAADGGPAGPAPVKPKCPESSRELCATCPAGSYQAGAFITHAEAKKHEGFWTKFVEFFESADKVDAECPVFACRCQQCAPVEPCRLDRCPVGTTTVGGIEAQDENGCPVRHCKCGNADGGPIVMGRPANPNPPVVTVRPTLVAGKIVHIKCKPIRKCTVEQDCGGRVNPDIVVTAHDHISTDENGCQINKCSCSAVMKNPPKAEKPEKVQEVEVQRKPEVNGGAPKEKFSPCEKLAAKTCLRKCKAKCDNGVGNGPDCRPGRARFNNDDVGGVPGAPGARGGGADGTEYTTSEKGNNQVVNANLVFQGDEEGTFRRTICNDKCEDEEIQACKK